MNLTATQIEDIVRVVVERLQTSVAAASVHAAPVKGIGPGAVVPSQGEVHLSGRVITLDALKEQWVGAQSVVIHPQAVVTPAVKDLLRQQRIRLVRQVPGSTSKAIQPTPLLLVTSEALHAVLSQRVCSQQATTIAARDAASTASQIQQNLSEGKIGAIWCSDTPFASVAATFGHARLRAVQLTDLRDLPRAIAQAQPNLLIVDCHIWTAPAIANLVRNWFRSLH